MAEQRDLGTAKMGRNSVQRPDENREANGCVKWSSGWNTMHVFLRATLPHSGQCSDKYRRYRKGKRTWRKQGSCPVYENEQRRQRPPRISPRLCFIFRGQITMPREIYTPTRSFDFLSREDVSVLVLPATVLRDFACRIGRRQFPANEKIEWISPLVEAIRHALIDSNFFFF